MLVARSACVPSTSGRGVAAVVPLRWARPARPVRASAASLEQLAPPPIDQEDAEDSLYCGEQGGSGLCRRRCLPPAAPCRHSC